MTKKVRILDGVQVNRQHRSPGEILEVSDNLANILVSGNRAEFVKDPVVPKWPVKENADGAKNTETPENPLGPPYQGDGVPPVEQPGEDGKDTPVEPSESGADPEPEPEPESEPEPEPAEENPSPTLPASGEGGKKGGKK